MSNIKSLAFMATAATLFSFASATTATVLTTPVSTAPTSANAFDALANTNMAVYWGQGPYQQRLSHFCMDSKIDIIPIGFVNMFPDQTGGYPGINFGNQCGDTNYTNPDGTHSHLLNDCPNIGPDIATCQQLGKKILLSLGGAIPSNQHLNSDSSATAFATFLWRAFGPNREPTGSTFPRPFGSSAVDGFDFDIESVLVPGENQGDLNRGYATMINTLRGFYAAESKPHYISGAPQCVLPDAHLANAIQNSWFDFLFVQFYNTRQCSARAFFDHSYGANGGPATNNISFDGWVNVAKTQSLNKHAKVFLGLPAAPDPQVVVDSAMYLQPAEAKTIIDAFQCKYPKAFGGVMLYEATFSENNAVNGKPYADVLKGYLTSSKCAKAQPAPVQLPSSSILLPSLPASTGSIVPGSSSPVSTKASSVTLSLGTAPLSFGTAPPIKTGTAPLVSVISVTPLPSVNPTGSIIPTLSKAPYPLSNISIPASSISTLDIVTTVIVTSYVTTCPVTQTVISGGSQVIQTTNTVSTVFSTITSTVCTKCLARATSTPMPSKAVSSVSEQEAVTTVIVYTTLTTCPVTKTITSGTKEILQTTQTVSTITSSVTSTITTKAPATVAAKSPGPANTSAASPAQTVPNSPVQSSPAGSQPATSGAPAQNANSPVAASEAPSAAAQSSSPASQSSLAAPNSPAAASSANSPQAASSAPSSPAPIHNSVAPEILTLTIVPVPVTTTQFDQAAQSTQSVQPGNSGPPGTQPSNAAPFPANNSTAPASPSGSASASASASVGHGSASPIQPTPFAFTGAASKMGRGLAGLVVVALTAVFML